MELERAKVAGMPVVENGVVVGVVTLRDLFRAADVPSPRGCDVRAVASVRARPGPRGKTVGDVMSRHALTVEAEQSVAATAGVMCEGGVNRVPVVDGEHHVVGILTPDDVVTAVAVPMNESAGAQRRLASPADGPGLKPERFGRR